MESQGTSRTLSTTRLEAFSDGVLAIAITLLVLDLALHGTGTPFDQLLRGWPSYLAYVISFLTIGITWIGHSAITDRLERVDGTFMRLNLVFLMVVAFLPFPTRLVAESLHEDHAARRVFTVLYGLTLLVIRVLMVGLDAYARRAGLEMAGAPEADLAEARSSLWWVVLAYSATIVLTYLVPAVGIFLYFGIVVVLIFPFKSIRLKHASPDM